MSDLRRFDLHVHSRYSPDSRLSLEQIVARLPYVGLRGFALTDHNSVGGQARLADLQAQHPGYLFLPAVEVSTVEGHLLAYGLHEAPPPHRPLAESVEWVRARGGEPVPAHPFRWTHGIGRAAATTVAVKSMEVRNGHNSVLANARAELLAAQRGLGATGGSDGHAEADLGQAYTEFPEGVASHDDLLEAIRRGRTSAGGRSLTWPGRVRLGLGTGARFVARGMRPL
jgi:predicted metal-dependent phosphoesterase TrpH